MIHLKSTEEILVMQEGGRRLRKVIEELRPLIQEGISTNEIDQKAAKLILKQDGEPSFKRVPNYYWSTCLPINEQVVHTPPSNRTLKNGDILTLDIGMYYNGYHTDYADSIAIGTVLPEIKKFLQVGKSTLIKAIQAVQKGKRLGVVSETIEDEINSHGYKIMKELTGHGIGKELHEDPYVFGYRQKKTEKTIPMQEGLVLAIEIIYSMSSEQITYEKGNEWSIVTSDHSLSACFEHTVAITHTGTIVLT